VKNQGNKHPKYYLYNRIVKAKLFIDANYSENIDLHNISDEAYFSKFHFIRIFKSIYGKSPHQYLIQVRIEKAKEFLQQDLSVSETCPKVGFESVSTFTELFKKITGTTPSAYQFNYKTRQHNIKLQPFNFIPNCFAEQTGWIKNSNFEEVT
jgi:AraC-like DNA-binding protein